VTDDQILVIQIGRPLRSQADVIARCPLGLPVVTRLPPILDDGTPMPTRYWLSCPLAQRRVARLESSAGVKAMDRKIRNDSAFATEMSEAHNRYAQERAAAVPEGASPTPRGGVAGIERGAKCLHAHYADTAAGNQNPIGTLVQPWIEPLDCTEPCVVGSPAGPVRNRKWAEPK